MGLLLLPLDAPEELDELFCDLGLLVLEADRPLAVIRLDAMQSPKPAWFPPLMTTRRVGQGAS